MSRLPECFKRLKGQKRTAFIPYIEAFDPDKDTSLKLLKAMPQAGADIIEIGMPFSDPAADGPAIQQAGRRALRAGATLRGVLDMVSQFRKDNQSTPLVLMGYANPIENYGYQNFCRDAARCGVDGLIIVDLPPDESGVIDSFACQESIDIIRLLTPVTQGARLDYVLSKASGFLYYVSIVGITGTRSATAEELDEAIARLRQKTSFPIVIGFGIKTPQKAAQAARSGDGVVVGSALVSALSETLDEHGRPSEKTIPIVLDKLSALARATHAKKAIKE